MAGPCLDPSPQIDLTVTGSPPALRATPILSPDAGNGLQNRTNGMWTPSAPPLVAGSLPSSPVDGDEILYVAESTNRTLWHLRYDAAETTTYKWKFVGGFPLFAKRDPNGTIAASGGNAWTNLAASDVAGPSVVLPLAGFYLMEFGAQIDAPVDGSVAQVGVSAQGFDPANEDTASNANVRTVSVSGSRDPLIAAIAAGTSMRLMYRAGTGTGTATYGKRWIKGTPLKVG